MGRNAELKERQKWSNEKPKFDSARRLRGIYYIDPEDKEFKETIQNACKKLETPMAPAMPCKTSKTCKHGETSGKTNEFKSKFACILEASESTRLRMGESLPNHHFLFVLETIRTGAMRVIHIPVKTEETQRLRIKIVLYCPICALNLKIKRTNNCRKKWSNVQCPFLSTRPP